MGHPPNSVSGKPPSTKAHPVYGAAEVPKRKKAQAPSPKPIKPPAGYSGNPREDQRLARVRAGTTRVTGAVPQTTPGTLAVGEQTFKAYSGKPPSPDYIRVDHSTPRTFSMALWVHKDDASQVTTAMRAASLDTAIAFEHD